MKLKNIGSKIDDFLAEEGILEDVQVFAAELKEAAALDVQWQVRLVRKPTKKRRAA